MTEYEALKALEAAAREVALYRNHMERDKAIDYMDDCIRALDAAEVVGVNVQEVAQVIYHADNVREVERHLRAVLHRIKGGSDE